MKAYRLDSTPPNMLNVMQQQITIKKLGCVILLTSLLFWMFLFSYVFVKIHNDNSEHKYVIGRPPLHVEHQPMIDDAKFTHENDQLLHDIIVNDNHQSDHGNHQSVHNNHQSVHNNHQSVHNNHQSVYDNHQSVHNNHQSVYDNHQSVQENHQKPLTGFALSFSYWEQQTNALLNMWSFQKWANQSGNLSVVEPFANDSVLEFPRRLSHLRDLAHQLRFRDYFDLEYWTNETAKHGVPPLVTWDTFIKHASRKTVVVILAYEVPPGGVYINDDLKKHPECDRELERFNNLTKTVLDDFHFEVVKTVCFASYTTKQLQQYPTLEKFNSYLTVNDQTNLTYWFSFWRGVQSDRITINHKVIERAYGGEEKALTMVRPSPRIIADSKNYVKTVLKVDSNKYTAVAFRTKNKKTAMVFQGYSRDTILNYFLKCASNISTVLNELQMHHGFLAIDLGRFGDWTSKLYFDYDSDDVYDGKGTKVFQTALDAVFGNKTVDEYHNDFITVTNGIEDSGYIGAMQKSIAENAECLLVIGGHSSFQRSMVQHHNSISTCVKYLCYDE